MNEKDIKILENYIYNKKDTMKEQLVQAIKNLLKENEELKNDLYEMTVSNNHKKENWIHKNVLNSYVPVAKIKERIKEFAKEFVETEKIEEELIFYILEGK